MPPKNTAKDTAIIGPRAIAVLLGVLLSHSPLWAAPVQTQKVGLAPGWNLISIQVGPSFALPAIQSGLSNKLISVWTYDSEARRWLTYQATNAAYPHDLATLMPGRGYWMQMSATATLSVTGETWTGALDLSRGWNLVGFPGLELGTMELPELNSIFRDQFTRVPQMWTWEGGTSQRFIGFDTAARPPTAELNSVKSGKGYWVYALDPITLLPNPVIALAADSDISPLQPEVPYTGSDPRYQDQLVRYAGAEDEDTDLNHNDILDAPYTQDTLIFLSGVNQQLITIGNSGAGLLNWSIDSTISWLAFDQIAGVTASELDTVRLTVDRAGRLPGYYTNTFVLYAGNLTRLITSILQVPTAAGDYRGYASAQRVNGKEISLGKVDLNLSLFNETDAYDTNRFRGVINRDKALLFPKDVFMNGVFYQGLDFSLTTSFEMPAGDRNAPPYNTFARSTNDRVLFAVGILPDADFNGDGVLNNENIFPFAIRREVTLLGSRTTADRLEGTYIEAIQGALPGNQRIYIEGIFSLDRESLIPTRKSIYSGRTNTIVAIGGSVGGRSSYTNAITVNSDVRINGAVLTVLFDFPAPQGLDIFLYGPDGTHVIHLTNILSGAALTLTNFNGLIGRGRWELVINWNPLTGERGFFSGWELRLEGLAFYNASGSVVAVSGGGTTPVPDATVTLAGSNIIPQSNTATNGQFLFSSLSENDYFITVSKFGYVSATRSFSINASDTNLGAIVLTPITVTTPELVAAPYIGQAPLHVTFTPLIPPAVLASLGDDVSATWNFGDGSPLVTNQAASVAHIYQNGGSYRASVSLAGSLAGTNFTTDYLTALPAQPNLAALPSYTNFIFGGGFIGSIASPNSDAPSQDAPFERAEQIATNRLILLGGNELSIVSTQAFIHQESKRDSAAFDIDRFPFGLANQSLGPEDSDFFTQTNTRLHLQHPIAATRLLDTTVIAPFRMISTLGGFVFPPETIPWTDTSARVGAFKLQVGRVEDSPASATDYGFTP